MLSDRLVARAPHLEDTAGLPSPHLFELVHPDSNALHLLLECCHAMLLRLVGLEVPSLIVLEDRSHAVKGDHIFLTAGA